MQPFQSVSLHPQRGTLRVAGMVVESGADTEHYGLNALPVRRHPFLLLWAAKPNK